jgi:type VI secretion system secreted protein Hcp
MTLSRKTIGIVGGAAAVGLLVIVWGLNAGPLDPSAPPASTMKSMQELYDLTNSMKGAALPAPLVSQVTDMFLWVEGIPGESTDDKHRDWIDVSAFHWSVSRSGRQSAPEGQPALPAEQADLTLVKRIDKASPLLFLACCTGQHIKEVRFNVCKTGEAPYPIYWFTLADVIVTSVKPVGASVGATPYLMEEISLNYATIEMYYRPIINGAPGTTVPAKWDLRTNKPI